MPAGSHGDLLASLAQTMVMMKFMDMGQHSTINPEVVMLDSKSTSQGTTYIATSGFLPLFPVPGMPSGLKNHSTVVYVAPTDNAPNFDLLNSALASI
jgi:hypothetical protein